MGWTRVDFLKEKVGTVVEVHCRSPFCYKSIKSVVNYSTDDTWSVTRDVTTYPVCLKDESVNVRTLPLSIRGPVKVRS